MGCYTCLARRIRCDDSQDRAGVCANCARINEVCRRTAPSEFDVLPRGKKGYTQAGTKRRRTLLSCRRCRRLKRKCDGESPCGRCAKSKSECEYSNTQPEDVDESDDATGLAAAAREYGCKAAFPDYQLLRFLVDEFFGQIAPSRMMGFIHKPTFMNKLDGGWSEDADRDTVILVLAMCAAAARLDYKNTSVWGMGEQWANDAYSLLMSNLNKISIAKLMGAILLYEYESRSGHVSASFLVTSILVRYTQVLQLNLEYTQDVTDTSKMTTTEREARRRLFWCCYMIDAQIATGIRKLQMIDERDIKIQLPMCEENFMFEKPCVTQRLDDPPAARNMDHRGFLVRIMQLRSAVLTYVKQFEKDVSIWSPKSEFHRILSDLDAWYTALPQSLHANSTTFYIRKEQNLLSPLINLHVLFHLCYLDLYRLVIPGLNYSLRTQIDAIQQSAPPGFINTHQLACFRHACHLSELFAMGMRHDELITDPLLTIAPHEVIRALVQYSLLKDVEICNHLYTSLEFLKRLVESFPRAKLCLDRAEAYIQNSGLPIQVSNSDSNAAAEGPVRNTGIEGTLHPLAGFRAVRDSIADRHGTEETTAASTAPLESPQAPADDPILNTVFSPSLETWLLGTQFGEFEYGRM